MPSSKSHRQSEIYYQPAIDPDEELEQPSDTSDDGLKQSPCKLRPDTWAPCELLSSSKNNDICFKCGLRVGRLGTPDNSEDRKKMVELLAEQSDEPEYSEDLSESTEEDFDPDLCCVFEGCRKPAKFADKTLCYRHDYVVRERRSRGITGAELYAPVRAYNLSKIKGKTHATI